MKRSKRKRVPTLAGDLRMLRSVGGPARIERIESPRSKRSDPGEASRDSSEVEKIGLPGNRLPIANEAAPSMHMSTTTFTVQDAPRLQMLKSGYRVAIRVAAVGGTAEIVDVRMRHHRERLWGRCEREKAAAIHRRGGNLFSLRAGLCQLVPDGARSCGSGQGFVSSTSSLDRCGRALPPGAA